MDFREQQRQNREARRAGMDAGVRVVKEPRQARPVRLPAQDTLIPCDFRSSAALGKLVCNCSGAAVVWGCSQPQVVEHNGMCIPETPRKWMDGPLKRVDGTVSTERYLPWIPSGDGEMRKDGIVLCNHCQFRQSAERLISPMVWQPQPSWDGELRFIRNQDLTNDTMELIPQLPSDIVGVIGIPVSGMIPAAYLSRMLCVPLYSFDFKEGVVAVGDGRRSRSVAKQDGVYLVVDDTVYTGGEMKKTRMAMKKMDLKCIYASVYTRDPKAVDIYAVHAPGSVILEWNIFNSGTLAGRTMMPECKGGICTDFDGVICEEPPVNDLRQPDQFQWWLTNARPQYLPRKVEVPLIVSFRIEPWRAVTEAWMARWGVKTKNLVLHPSQTIQERNRTHNVAEHKGKLFRDSPCSIMFESDERQARVIADTAGKLVIVPTSGKIIKPAVPVAKGTVSVSGGQKVAEIKYQPITVRNLIYHVYAPKHSDEWKKNIAELVKYWGVFNGKKIVCVAKADDLHSTAFVREHFPSDAEFYQIQNDRALREQATFGYLLSKVENVSENEATFYSHTKGTATSGPITGVRRWRNMMYRVLLDDMDTVQDRLQRYAAVGTTKMVHDKKSWKFPTRSLPTQWIFAGTFFWFRHDAVFGIPESDRPVACDVYGVEGWLGGFLRPEDGCSLFQPWPERTMDGHDPWAYDPKWYGEKYD